MIFYNDLGVAGKSLEDIKKMDAFGFVVYSDTLIHGISSYRRGPSEIYPIVYNRDTVTIMFTRAFLEDNYILELYFETKGDSSKVIFGYKYQEEMNCL